MELLKQEILNKIDELRKSRDDCLMAFNVWELQLKNQLDRLNGNETLRNMS